MLIFLTKILDLFFPRSLPVQNIECLSPAQFRCRARPPPRLNLVALRDLPIAIKAFFDYRQPLVRQAIWELKYRGNLKIAYLFAALLSEEIEIIRHQTSKKIVVLPLPNSALRRQERGWNQIELITRYITSISVRTDILRKIRHTPPQATLKNRARLKNLTGSFVLSKKSQRNLPKNSLIILLDDVTTTGSTFANAFRTLAAAGHTDTYCIAIAH